MRISRRRLALVAALLPFTRLPCEASAMRYRRNTREVDAILFDGSAESAAAISSRFAGGVAHHNNQVEVSAPGGRVWAGAGCWIVRDRATRRLSVVDPRDFAANYQAAVS